ncbi:MAG: dehydrogenase [Gammaproteobacteria bacterium]|nr:dehydrogenase [Gammaproteobacteria bacterium]
MSVSHKSVGFQARKSTAGVAGGKPDAEHPVGEPLARVDGPLKVRGKARFAAEFALENLTYAALSYSTIAKGRIASINADEAKAAPGVLLVLTHENVSRLSPPPLFPEGAAGSTLPVMQDASIHWNGEPVALVIAESQEQADRAARLIRVTYEPEIAAIEFETVRAKAKAPKNILGEPTCIAIGDAEAALAQAPVRIDNIYRTPRHNHCAIELHALTAAWEGDALTVHDSTQMVHLTQKTLAKVFGVAEQKVRVLAPFVGGAFGNKSIWNHQILAIAAARMVGRPVRLVLSREGVFRETGGRTLTEQRVALGANADGTLAALIHTGIAGMTAHNDCPEQFTFPARHLYAAQTFLLSQKVAELNIVANTFMRAPGEAVGTFALECAMDELAEALNLDPIELRRLLEPDKDPVSGLPFSQRSLIEAYRRGAERFGWQNRSPVPGARSEGEWLIGQGVATATYPYHRFPGGVAKIRLSADGQATVQMGVHEMGMGTATVQAQYAAELLALPVECVTFEYGDSSLPSGVVAGGSCQSASIIAAVNAACEALFDELLKLVGHKSPLTGLIRTDVEAYRGGIRHRRDTDRFQSYVAILNQAGKDVLECEAPASEPSEAKRYSMHSYGAQFCEVRVNTVTGETRVSRWLASFDTGRILNARTAASQFRGGIIMGIGLALTEETFFDERTGRIMNPSLAEYHVPVHLDVPQIEVMWNGSPDPQSPYGVRGIGEIGITGAGAAIANAIYNATGRRIRELPITLDRLL